MADGLNDQNEEIRKIATSYFENDEIRSKIFPRLKLHGILATRKKAVNEFYGTLDYLDKLQPILKGDFTEPEYVRTVFHLIFEYLENFNLQADNHRKIFCFSAVKKGLSHFDNHWS